MSYNLTADVYGDDYNDLELALEEILRAIRQEYRSGTNSNDTGEYYFEVTEVSK